MSLGLRLPEALTRFGVPFETVPGWESRSAGSLNPEYDVAHWTAGPLNTLGRPSLNTVVYGRPGLPGPLCNLYGDRYGVMVIVSAHRANHAGNGWWNGGARYNSDAFGTEMEGTVLNGDSTGTDFTDAQLAVYPRVIAAYHWLMGTPPAQYSCGHSEWAPNRKIDIGSLAASLRNQAQQLWLAGGAAPAQEDDMATPNDIWMAPCTAHLPDGSSETHPAVEWITIMAQRIAAIEKNVGTHSDANANAQRLIDLEKLVAKIAAKVGA